MNLICKLFGHRPAFGYCNREGEGYFSQHFYATDGLGITHANLLCDCERCGQNYQVGKIHVLSREELLRH